MEKALVCGAGGFIGGHLVKRLKKEGHFVRGVDIKMHEYTKGDLRDPRLVEEFVDEPFDELYKMAADMGGAGFVL